LLASERFYNATVEDISGRRRAAELVFLDSGPLVLRAVVVLIAAIGCGVGGNALFRLHLQLAARAAAGGTLNPFQTLLATGSSARTAWPGWVAAAFFLLAVTRLRRGPPEPSPGVIKPERLTARQLRTGLRVEYRVVRIALVVLSLAAATDIARAAAHIVYAQAGHDVSGSTIVATTVEAAGFATAAAVLALWAWIFGADVRRLGAL
jgi:hypothetical protein